MYLSESRAVITKEAHAKWASLIQEVISQPDIAPAFLDPRRIWNMVRFQTFLIWILIWKKLTSPRPSPNPKSKPNQNKEKGNLASGQSLKSYGPPCFGGVYAVCFLYFLNGFS